MIPIPPPWLQPEKPKMGLAATTDLQSINSEEDKTSGAVGRSATEFDTTNVGNCD
jgi:hypothetical protein